MGRARLVGIVRHEQRRGSTGRQLDKRRVAFGRQHLFSSARTKCRFIVVERLS